MVVQCLLNRGTCFAAAVVVIVIPFVVTVVDSIPIQTMGLNISQCAFSESFRNRCSTLYDFVPRSESMMPGAVVDV